MAQEDRDVEAVVLRKLHHGEQERRKERRIDPEAAQVNDGRMAATAAEERRNAVAEAVDRTVADLVEDIGRAEAVADNILHAEVEDTGHEEEALRTGRLGEDADRTLAVVAVLGTNLLDKKDCGGYLGRLGNDLTPVGLTIALVGHRERAEIGLSLSSLFLVSRRCRLQIES